MRRSSRGNPYHDEKGRFTSPNRYAVKTNEKDYEKQTSERGKKVLLNCNGPLGKVVLTSRSKIHITKRHPIMGNWKNLKAVQDVLKNPEFVYQSREIVNGESQPREVYFAKTSKATFGDKKYIRVIVGVLNGRKEIITAFPCSDIKGVNAERKIYEREN